MEKIDDRIMSAETAVIGCLVENSTAEAYSALTEEMFIAEITRTVFRACKELYEQSEYVGFIPLVEKLGNDDMKVFIFQCVETTPNRNRLNDYINIVRENWRIRDMQNRISEILLGLVPGTTVKDTITELENIVEFQRKIESELTEQSAKSMMDCLAEWLLELNRPNTAIKTGFGLLDYLTGGLQRKGLYVISARTGDGKTDFALNLALKMSRTVRVNYNTLEMPRTQCTERIVSNVTYIDSGELRDKKLTPDQFVEIAKVTDYLSRGNIFVDEQEKITAADVKSKILKYRPDVIFLDNLQIMGATQKRKNQHEEIADTTAMLKSIALKQNIVIVLLVQESREADKGNTPKLGNLKGSSQIESDADGVFFLRPERTDKILRGTQYLETKLYVAKNRHGGTGVCTLCWQPQFHRYTEFDTLREED